MRTPLIAGNWKMNMTSAQAVELVKGIHYGLRFPGEVDVIVAPPLTALGSVAGVLRDSYIGVAAQNMHWEETGAYTGEVSGLLIKEAGADYVIIGHSERRQYFGETDETVNKKAKAAFKHGLIPIICVGETLDERESGSYAIIIEQQLMGALNGLTPQEVSDLIIAYEPVWAIGTGETATARQADEAHAVIRSIISREFGTDTADTVRILYGGSVNPGNSKETLSMTNVDGALVGGASLKYSDFIEIIKSACRLQ